MGFSKGKFSSRNEGWFPKETVYAMKPSQPRWRERRWVAVAFISVILLAFFIYSGAEIIIRYSNPVSDVAASYFETFVNRTNANVGEIVEVKVLVGWHGYIFPEFLRHVEIVSPFPESNFRLVSGSNTQQYIGYGGGTQLSYSLEVINENLSVINLPNPQLHLDNALIQLNKVQGVLK